MTDHRPYLKHIAQAMGVEVITDNEFMRRFATSNLILPFMSYGERLKLARKCDAKIEKPPFRVRFLWWFKPFIRRLTRRGRSANSIIKTLLM